mmetsp:Transcript_26509/g.72864  ORF Transcript_26509/g.72864 Transcript_26509/m.72864 type:complete len:391 (-) Transcript_26509:678-1850(-)
MNLSSHQEVVLSIIAYSLCSGSLVLLNKFTLHYLPFPSLVVALQLIACITIVYSAKVAGIVKVDEIKWEYVKPYLLYILFFSVGVYCNMRSLNVSNVETVIVFRALTPMIVTFLDVFFLGREWPSLRSWAGLTTLVGGAYGYASFDEQFQTQGLNAYFWPTLYTIVIALEMVSCLFFSAELITCLSEEKVRTCCLVVSSWNLTFLGLLILLQAYGKKIVKSVPLQTLSGPVIYTNMLTFIPMLMFAAAGNEYSAFWEFYWGKLEGKLPAIAVSLLLCGSLVGTGIGYSGWWCRSVVSATSFTLVGVMNKCLTVIFNNLIWDQHASREGTFYLLVCVTGGIIYKQAPMRSAESSEPPISVDDVEFKAEIGSDEALLTKDIDSEDSSFKKSK